MTEKCPSDCGANCRLNHLTDFLVNRSATCNFILYLLRPNPFNWQFSGSSCGLTIQFDRLLPASKSVPFPRTRSADLNNHPMILSKELTVSWFKPAPRARLSRVWVLMRIFMPKITIGAHSERKIRTLWQALGADMSHSYEYVEIGTRLAGASVVCRMGRLIFRNPSRTCAMQIPSGRKSWSLPLASSQAVQSALISLYQTSG